MTFEDTTIILILIGEGKEKGTSEGYSNKYWIKCSCFVRIQYMLLSLNYMTLNSK